VNLSEIERGFTLDHSGPDLGLVAIVLHERLTRGNRILLGSRNAYGQPEYYDSAEGSDHVTSPFLL
jgi:hypothetical protein